MARRLLIMCAVFLGLSVAAGSLRPGDAVVREGGRTPGEAQAIRDAGPPEGRRVTIDADGPRKRVTVDVGAPLHLEVASREPAVVQLGDEGQIDAADPQTPARFDVLPDREGTLEVALLDPRRVVARITVRR